MTIKGLCTTESDACLQTVYYDCIGSHIIVVFVRKVMSRTYVMCFYSKIALSLKPD